MAGDLDFDAYYKDVQSAYDRIAPLYDDSVGRYAVSSRAKKLALEVIKAVTPSGGRVLDVGCYTGTEALALAQAGFSVVGIDISPQMTLLAETKARRRRLSSRARFMPLRASDLHLLSGVGIEPFDTVYSVYGTLNLEPRVDRFKNGLSVVLKREGAFVCGLLNPTVLYELLLDPLLLKFHGYRKLKKKRVPTRIGFGRERVETFLYGPTEFAKLLGPGFALVEARGLHILYPPPRFESARATNRWWVARSLDAVERRLERHFPFADLGFFSLLVFRRVSFSGSD